MIHLKHCNSLNMTGHVLPGASSTSKKPRTYQEFLITSVVFFTLQPHQEKWIHDHYPLLWFYRPSHSSSQLYVMSTVIQLLSLRGVRRYRKATVWSCLSTPLLHPGDTGSLLKATPRSSACMQPWFTLSGAVQGG